MESAVMVHERPAVRRTHFLAPAFAPLPRDYGLMGEHLHFETNDERLLRVADEAFGNFPIPASHASAPLIVRLICQGEKTPLACDPPRATFFVENDLFTISTGAHGFAAADLQDGFAFGCISPALAAHPAYVRYTFVEALGLAMLGQGRGYITVHAACVVKNGVSILLQAQSGVGKSTLAYACLRRGFRLLAEDVVFVQSGAPLRLWGAPWKLHLLPDAAQLFPELCGLEAQLQMNGEWKLELDVPRRFPGGAQVSAAPGPVALLERGAAAGGLHRLTAQQAGAAFEVLWPWRAGWNERLEASAQRLLDGGVYRLAVNGAPDEAVDWLEALVEGCLG